MIITPAQFKEARQLLKWTQGRVAAEIGLSPWRIARYETRQGTLSALQISTLRRTFEAAGVEFIVEHGGSGVRLRKGKP
jgi:transcriptional regulator with XRE-family HTH domain